MPQKIEVVEFYPFEIAGGNAKGSLHIYLCDLGVDLRGIFVAKDGDKWKFKLPIKKTIDIDTKLEVMYPVFNFTDRTKHKELLQEIRRLGKEYICKNYLKEERKKPKYYEAPPRKNFGSGYIPNKKPEERTVWKRPLAG